MYGYCDTDAHARVCVCLVQWEEGGGASERTASLWPPRSPWWSWSLDVAFLLSTLMEASLALRFLTASSRRQKNLTRHAAGQACWERGFSGEGWLLGTHLVSM